MVNTSFPTLPFVFRVTMTSAIEPTALDFGVTIDPLCPDQTSNCISDPGLAIPRMRAVVDGRRCDFGDHLSFDWAIGGCSDENLLDESSALDASLESAEPESRSLFQSRWMVEGETALKTFPGRDLAKDYTPSSGQARKEVWVSRQDEVDGVKSSNGPSTAGSGWRIQQLPPHGNPPGFDLGHRIM
ncbi:uncharacterized protein Z520_11702 [Fonsecaea multimorphosa CBS 102226]|uniref:Uncharacterized protein n=1 Tax=Fonsecaea multimorphosa CBS 102226 TaxID=1442371 RepID=A0A0D2I5I1_9EURO|nr:uncharacterized protein Z520_11702 [Fonsecaea multimorphosa CBS 102226]KIX92526.1 hypothetical protein Z520_11702 [Fonsecaea multimorphosa CBS 102226]OAL17355.1 hypothetical protein AYO22_11722 [Fonsecaea multimorphosa]